MRCAVFMGGFYCCYVFDQVRNAKRDSNAFFIPLCPPWCQAAPPAAWRYYGTSFPSLALVELASRFFLPSQNLLCLHWFVWIAKNFIVQFLYDAGRLRN